MLETPTDNPKLNFDQLQAIDITQKRLGNLESEIVIATKVLKSTKMETDRATKEHSYQNELLETTKAQLDIVQSNLISTSAELSVKEIELSKINAEIGEKTSIQIAKDMEFKDREDAIVKAELEIAKKAELVSRSQQDINSKYKDFDEKVAKIKEVISIF